MSSVELDRLVAALQSEVATAQARISKQHQGRVDRLMQLDREGAIEMIRLSFVVDGETGPEKERQESVCCPLAILRPHRAPQVDELIFEFDAEVQPVQQEDDAGSNRLSLVIRRPARWFKRRLLRVKIWLRGPQPGDGVVHVNGKVLKRYPSGGQDDAG